MSEEPWELLTHIPRPRHTAALQIENEMQQQYSLYLQTSLQCRPSLEQTKPSTFRQAGSQCACFCRLSLAAAKTTLATSVHGKPVHEE